VVLLWVDESFKWKGILMAGPILGGAFIGGLAWLFLRPDKHLTAGNAYGRHG